MEKINKDSAIPFYIQIKEEIIKFATNNDSTKALPHHEELARIFGTSRFTVARAVAELKKENVLKAVKGRGTFLTGGRPSVENNAVIEKKNLITFIIPTTETSPMFQGAQLECEKYGYHILLKNDEPVGNPTREGFISKERDFLIKYRDGKLGDSLILYYEGGKENLDIINDLLHSRRPLVFIDRLPDSLCADYVGYDNFNTGRMVAEELIKTGKKNIAIVGIGRALSSIKEQVDGYKKALSDNDLEIKEENVISGIDFYYYWQEKDCVRFKEKFHAVKDKVDAIYFMTPSTEHIILDELKPKDLKRNIALVGGDRTIIRDFQDRYVFKVRKPSFRIGEEAVKLLNSRLSSVTWNKTEQIRLPVELVRQER